MRYIFAGLDEKHKLLGNSEKILKVFDEIFLWKWNFYFLFIFFKKFVTKNRAFRNSTIFYNKFFRFRGGGNFPLPPCLRPWLNRINIWNIFKCTQSIIEIRMRLRACDCWKTMNKPYRARQVWLSFFFQYLNYHFRTSN